MRKSGSPEVRKTGKMWLKREKVSGLTSPEKGRNEKSEDGRRKTEDGKLESPEVRKSESREVRKPRTSGLISPEKGRNESETYLDCKAGIYHICANISLII